MERNKGIIDIFFEIDHRMKREGMEAQFNKEVKQGCTFAADASRINHE